MFGMDRNARLSGSDIKSGRRDHGEIDGVQGQPQPVKIKKYYSDLHLATAVDMRGNDIFPNQPHAKPEDAKIKYKPAKFRLAMDDELIKLLGSPEGKYGILMWGVIWPVSDVKEDVIIQEDRYVSARKGVVRSISAI